jgi:signal transduction histidine kinase
MLTSNNLNVDEFKRCITFLNENFDFINHNLKRDHLLADVAHETNTSLLVLSSKIQTCLRTYKNLKKKCKRKLSADFSAIHCELKRKKLREKREVLNQLQTSIESRTSSSADTSCLK